MPMESRNQPLRVAKLVRVSTHHLEQADSPRHQESYIEAETRRNGWQETGLCYQAELTGAVILDRPDIQRMLADARAGAFDAIVLKSVSRLGRDTLGLLMVKRMLDDLQVELIALADGYRSGRDPELIFLVHAERAQAGRQEIAKSVRAGIVQAARRGIWPAGRLPFGLRKVGRFAVEPDPETAPVVCLIFRLRALGWGLVRICAHLNGELRVRAPQWWHLRAQAARVEAAGEAGHDERVAARLARLRARLAAGRYPWHPRTVRLLLANTAYRGELRYNRTGGGRRMHGRPFRAPRDPAEWVSIPCPALVSPAEWAAAQAVGERPAAGLQRRRRSDGGAAPPPVWLLAGLAVCGQCGAGMRGQAARRNSGGRGGDPKGYYVCRRALEGGLHRAEYFPAAALEAAVLSGLQGHIAALPPPPPGLALPAHPRRPDRARLESRLKDLAEARFFRREELRRGSMTAAEFAAELELIRAQEQELRERLERLALPTTPDAEPGGPRAAAARLLRPEAGEAARALAAALVCRVVVGPGHAQVYL